MSGAAKLAILMGPRSRQVGAAAGALPGSGGGGAVAGAYAMITSKVGTVPPYVYAAAQATMSVAGVWSAVAGGTAYDNLYNVEEQGLGGQWVNPLSVGDVVLITAAPDASVAAYVCQRSHYRGTYL